MHVRLAAYILVWVGLAQMSVHALLQTPRRYDRMVLRESMHAWLQTPRRFGGRMVLRESMKIDDQPKPTNLVGGALQPCSFLPKTGYFRDGFCNTCEEDTGSHTVCVRVTEQFLAFSKSVGNDLSTPYPDFGFAGLKPGDAWCLCASRWVEAHKNGCAPQVVVAATHSKATNICSFEALMKNTSDDPFGEDEMQ